MPVSATNGGRTVLVTGASRGLGLGITRALAASGFGVVALARQKTKQVTDAIAETKQAKHGAVHFVPFDLDKIDEIPELVKELRKDFGPLFGLVNNAAVGHDGAQAMMHNSRIDELIRLNTLSPIILTKYVVRSMMSQGGDASSISHRSSARPVIAVCPFMPPPRRRWSASPVRSPAKSAGWASRRTQ
jgi:short-subunit dehydrogenase